MIDPSFAGCGFLGIYHVGVGISLTEYAPHLVGRVAGASAGSLAAAGLLCGVPLDLFTSENLRISKVVRSHRLGLFSPQLSFNDLLLEVLDTSLPANAHEIVNGRLHISLTRAHDRKNVIVSHFDSREDLFQALICACFIPLVSGILPPKFHGVRYMDGGFSDNMPIIDDNTITVSPFCGETDICPRDDSAQLFHLHVSNTSIELSKQNMIRLLNVLKAPSPKLLSQICHQGFEDGLRFLLRSNAISCNRCIEPAFIFKHSPLLSSHDEDMDPECEDCSAQRKSTSRATLPETVIGVLKDAIESTNAGIFDWLFARNTQTLDRNSSGSVIKWLQHQVFTNIEILINTEFVKKIGLKNAASFLFLRYFINVNQDLLLCELDGLPKP